MNDPGSSSIFTCGNGNTGYCQMKVPRKQDDYYMIGARNEPKGSTTYDCSEQSGTDGYCCNQNFHYTDAKHQISTGTIINRACSKGKKTQ
ncbi:hypothetical protein PtB15_3B623 [Puccinia triticina]|nr:hypothetical protein PtB15_3B623 [Puccinia triticina]